MKKRLSNDRRFFRLKKVNWNHYFSNMIKIKSTLTTLIAASLFSCFGQVHCDSIPNDYTGFCIETYSDGIQKSITNYKNGTKHGLYQEFYHHGELGAQGNYVDGHIVGTYERYSPKGDVILKAKINKKGNGTLEEYNFNGAILTSGDFKKWRKSGKWVTYNYKGEIKSDTLYKSQVSPDASSTLINDFGFGEEPKGRVNFPDFESHFIGGSQALSRYISENVIYPEKALKNGTSGKVYVGFDIDEDGSIANVRIIRGVNESLDKEAIRLVQSMPPWDPAVHHGMRVKSFARLPINFILD